LGLKNKHDLQLTRLAIREQIIIKHEILADLADTIVNRYNPTQSRAEVFGLLSQTLTAPAVLNTVRDKFLLTELPATPV
jgi:hypothetical protein